MALEKELAALQDVLAAVDLNERSLRYRNGRPLVEFLVKTLQPIQIRMDANKNHRRPHVHVDYGKLHHVASYAIDNGERLVGTLDTKYDRKVRVWIGDHKTKLLQVWELTQAGQDAKPFVCQLLQD